ncbi:MAG: aminotransferase class I/II-fold pyridoxal phosphate-dependent enzyme, partial [Actinobacteria bacterium]|nr:aminotransferase class I/II-fold pyridoxal phosphate-dependent enzyme [Actinomycetota bacterium]
MRARRLQDVTGFGIDKVATAAGDDPDILRMENLDTDIAPPPGVVEATREAIGPREYNSWLPFSGRSDLKEAVADHVERRSGVRYDPYSEIVITTSDGTGMLDALLATTDPGDEIILTDPTYAGVINRVRLAGGVPRFATCLPVDGHWRIDLDSLRDAVTDQTRALFLQNATFPTGMVFNEEEWEAITTLVLERDLHLIYWSFMEGVLFDDRPLIHPASFEGMRDRTITLGAVTIEYRMIGWRIGWAIGNADTADAIGMVHIYNGLVASGFSQAGAIAALRSDPDDLTRAVSELQRRRDVVMEELEGLPAVSASGGWALLLDTEAMGIAPPEASQRLLEQKVAATPMTAWG